ncbi:protein downstream neighbor of son homolog [Macrosteles quadrilineatus]|uniref:protein downstream neighbor of son homolog n=1 Tax=Macrosteles quadrilineatus TaxID=74068 RepID=UPI0023E0C6C5|nr:protein downstream neighbor of son homolog [Macrosteles quadrilineatus]
MSESSSIELGAKTPEKWKRPEDVMKLHRLRMKKKALQARMNRSDIPQPSPVLNTSVDSAITKRKNPFRSNESGLSANLKKVRTTDEDEHSNDGTLFKLLNITEPEKDVPLNFTNILSRISSPAGPKLNVVLREGTKEPPVDWTLRTKVRFMAQKPFPWNTTLRTCEEASGITGFVRCVDSTNSSLDTSPNAQFHQCCLVWQHPVLPWLELYPRQSTRTAGAAQSAPHIISHPAVRDSLQRHWADSFRSLYQLLRARQCPYFYFVTNSFSCLFRAAGVCGFPHTHVLITPTTRGFRKSLSDQEIEFRMPLKPQDKSADDDTGYETLDASRSPEGGALSTTVVPDEADEEDGEEAEQWLQSMGVDSAEIKRISSVQADADLGKEKKVDRTPESLVLIEDTEAHVLFNMLLNCKSTIPTTGPLAGVPPTLLAPVAFQGATLRPLKVRESKVQVGGDSYYSMEMRGPILPTTVQQLCELLHSSLDQFSITLASHETTKGFTLSGHYTTISNSTTDKENAEDCSSNSAFRQEGLSDCGQSADVLRRFCSNNGKCLQQFDSLKYSDNIYSWT